MRVRSSKLILRSQGMRPLAAVRIMTLMRPSLMSQILRRPILHPLRLLHLRPNLLLPTAVLLRLTDSPMLRLEPIPVLPLPTMMMARQKSMEASLMK